VPITTKQRNVDGTYSLADATAVSLVVQRPDLTQQTYSTPTHDGTGLYRQDIPAGDLTQTGSYQYKSVSTGTAAGVAVGKFDIFDPFEPEVLSLEDLKTQLGIPLTDTTKDGELGTYAATAVQVIESLIGGPFLNRTVVEVVYPSENGRCLVLRAQGLVSVTSIVDMQSGASVSVSQLIVEPNSRVLRQKLWVPFYWVGPFQVTFVAGQGTAVPENVNVAGRIIAQQLWDTRRGPVARPSLGGDDVVIIGGFLVPRRAQQLLADYLEEAVVG
jgi:hypothetical protein